jgi:hypothetical protein
MSLDACGATDSDASMAPMGKRAARPSIGITDEDESNIELLIEAIPFLRSLKRAALLLYLARTGMDVLAENPLRALESAPTPETIRPNIEAAKARIREQRERGRWIPTPEELRGIPVTEEDHSRGPVERLRREREGETVKLPPPRPTKRPPPGSPKDRGSSGRTGSRGSEG